MINRRKILKTWSVALTLMSFFSGKGFGLDNSALKSLLVKVDDKQKNTGDYKSQVYIEETEKGKSTRVLEATVFRRDEQDKWMLIFSKPSTEAGKGYLRLEKNLFLYEPGVGKWERRTERTRIGGTNSQRGDFDQSRLAIDYKSEYVGLEKLGRFMAHHVKLTANEGADVANPILELWVEEKEVNILKRQEFSLNGKLMRTVFYPKWEKTFSKSKNADVFVPKEMRIFDEVEKGNNTTILLKEVSLDPLDPNIFTKAYIESKIR